MSPNGTTSEDHAEKPTASTSALPAQSSVAGAAKNEQTQNEVPSAGAGAAGGVTAAESSTTTLSKSQQRKKARQEKMAALKPERRARDRAHKKEKKAEKRRLVEEEGADPYEIGLKKMNKRVKRAEPFKANIVIDLGFDDKMSEKVCLIFC